MLQVTHQPLADWGAQNLPGLGSVGLIRNPAIASPRQGQFRCLRPGVVNGFFFAPECNTRFTAADISKAA